MERVKEQIAALKAEYKSLLTTLNTLQSTATTGDLRESVHELELARKELLGRLVPLRSGNVSLLSPEEKEKIEQARRRAQRDVLVRRKIFHEFWGMFCENLPEGLTKDEVWVRRHAPVSLSPLLALTPPPGTASSLIC